jgi:hypothetical protein
MKKTLLFTLALIAVGCTEPIPRNLDELVSQGETFLDRETMTGYTGPYLSKATPSTTPRSPISPHPQLDHYNTVVRVLCDIPV